MPYTPPTHRSPATSTPSSPDASRRPSVANASRPPALPRSASYLTRHRRTPSAPTVQNGIKYQPTPESTSEDLKMMMSSSLRKSPPPVTDGLGIPNGAILSPPESSASSDDDDVPEIRGRTLDNVEAEALHEAIRQIPQHRESSPSKTDDNLIVSVIPPQSPNAGLHASFSAGSLDGLGKRTHGHTRSATEPVVSIKLGESSTTASDADSEEELMMKKPQMVRKKSGELVRPALRPSSRRRPSSMPGTPTFSKAVHFDSHLEHVRHFLQVDRPLAVSAGSSPADAYESDTEFPFNADDRSGARSPPFEWEIIVTNFPVETPARKALPVRLERVWLSPDQKSLIGSVAVANLAFQKHVTCRFTLDYWKTTSEVAAEFSSEIRPKENPLGHDRFNFTIKLSEVANLESKTLYFCVRYNVNGQEHWDSNGGTNFQVDFRKKMLPQNGKRGFQAASARAAGELPRSNRRSNGANRQKVLPMGINEFGDDSALDFEQSIQDYLGDTGPIRLKGVKSTTSIPTDNITARLVTPSGQAFSNRYDFGASLTTAIQAAKQTSPKSTGDALYMKGNTRGSIKPAPKPVFAPSTNFPNGAKAIANDPVTKTQVPSTANNKSLPPFPAPNSPSQNSLASASYEELVNKYCFFGSKQSSPQLGDGTLRNGRFDGGDEDLSRVGQGSNDSSLNGSPLQMGGLNRGQANGSQANSRRDPNPYFNNALSGFAPSPEMSPVERNSSPAHTQPRSSVSSTPIRSMSPAMAGAFHQPMTGTSSSMPYQQHFHDRFPFSGADTHSATAIRG